MGRTKSSPFVDTRVIYCGDNLDQLRETPRRLRRPDLHRPAVQLQSQLRGLLGRDKGEASLRGPPRLDAGLHRVHAPAVRRARPRAQEDRQLLLPLRLARQPLRQGHARPDFRREQFHERNSLETQRAHNDAKQGSKHFGRTPRHHPPLRRRRPNYTFNHQYSHTTQIMSRILLQHRRGDRTPLSIRRPHRTRRRESRQGQSALRVPRCHSLLAVQRDRMGA